MDVARARRTQNPSQGRVLAVLGPTNTGKTHFAIERMLAHKTGMIGLPLRLLAREVYDRVVALKGANQAALITGEEKIVPQGARFFICTVEAMPVDLRPAFLAVDEIQLCADPERGHVFTDRLLHARGEEETIFLGSETMRGAIQRFIPRAYFITRERFSDLAHAGSKKLTRLPRRSAIVGFSAEDVYGYADLIRRQRGGAAVVLGALSPRTRNAQVALYQSGDVDFLVATDAIGMGINMDVDHVALAALEKFDGVGTRPLRPEEIGQIAGRAGRHMNDGTFGVTGDAPDLDEEIVARVESHRYEPVRVLQWRNPALVFHNLPSLLESLDAPAPTKGLVRTRPASDLLALRSLSHDDDITAKVTGQSDVRQLWEVCQLPDFRKLGSEEHAKLARSIFSHLSESGALPDDWLARQIDRLDNPEGDVATLSGRLAQIRTWTYASHRAGWTQDNAHWQEKTRVIEDKLSDALHECLTLRFIDRRTSVLMKRLREDDLEDLVLDESGGVIIGGEVVGKMEGFRFAPDPRAEGIHGRTLRSAALKGLEGEYARRAMKLIAAPDKEITLSEHGRLWWDGAIVARLTKGASVYEPKIQLYADEQLKALREGVQERLEKFLRDRIVMRLSPLLALVQSTEAKVGTRDALPAEARGIAHRLAENFGNLARSDVALPQHAGHIFRALKPFGIRFGAHSVFLPQLLKPDAASLLALLWGVQNLEQISAPPQAGLTSMDKPQGLDEGFLNAAGFRSVGPRAIRLDMLERLDETLQQSLKDGSAMADISARLMSLLGCDAETLQAVMAALGWQQAEVRDGEAVKALWRRMPVSGRKAASRDVRKPRPVQVRPDSPFAGLAALIGK